MSDPFTIAMYCFTANLFTTPLSLFIAKGRRLYYFVGINVAFWASMVCLYMCLFTHHEPVWLQIIAFVWLLAGTWVARLDPQYSAEWQSRHERW